MMELLKLVIDPYERKARATPGFLVVLPLLVVMVVEYGHKNPLLAALLSLVCACGGVFALANIVRGKGKELEERLVMLWGGMPTTIALRHCNNYLDSVSKQLYHSAFEKKLGIKMPTAAEEALEPTAADDIYIGATRRLRELTRINKGLVFKENIAYGFHRNMMGMRKLGIFTSLVGLGASAFRGGFISASPLEFQQVQNWQVDAATVATMLVSSALLLSWIYYFNADSVRRVGFVYAERLFECLNSIKTPRSGVTKKSGI